MSTRLRSKWPLIYLLIASLLIVPFNPVIAADRASELAGHWAEEAIQHWIDNGWIAGYEDGKVRPNQAITRAEFAALTNRAFNFQAKADLSFEDVQASQWFYGDVAAAVHAGYMAGYEEGLFGPRREMTRQEVAMAVHQLLSIAKGSTSTIASSTTSSTTSNVVNSSSASLAKAVFSDQAQIGEWAQAAVAAMVEQGIMSGYPDASFRPTASITRAEAVATLHRALAYLASIKESVEEAQVYDQPGTYGAADVVVDSDVIIAADGVVLKNMIINGDLIISEEVGGGAVYLRNVTVHGGTQIHGGGEASIYMRNSVLQTVVVDQGPGRIRLVVEGSTVIAHMIVVAPAMDGTAEGFALSLGKEAHIVRLELGGVAHVQGQGMIATVVLSDGARESSFETEPGKRLDSSGAEIAPAQPVLVNPNAGGGGSPQPEQPGSNPVLAEVDTEHALADFSVAYGTSEASVLAMLPAEMKVQDSDDARHTVAITWQLAGFDPHVAGEYTALGSFALPAGVDQANPAINLEVKVAITIEALNIEPIGIISDFEDGTADGWLIGENGLQIANVTTIANGPGTPYEGEHVLELLTTAVNGDAWRGVYKEFTVPLDASSSPEFHAAVNSYGAGPDHIYEARVRFFSGNESYEAVREIVANGWNLLTIDISGWPFHHAIDRIEISLRCSTLPAIWTSKQQLDFVGFREKEEVEELPHIVWYKFNEMSGSVAKDSSAFGRHGSLLNGAANGAGAKNRALVLDGQGGYVEVPAEVSAAIADDYTVLVGVRLEEASVDGDTLFAFAAQDGSHMSLSLHAAEEQIVYTIRANGDEQRIVADDIVIPLQQWLYISVVVNENTGILYVDGVEAGRNEQLSLHPADLSCPTANTIGKTSATRTLAGRVDDFRIVGQALTAAQISELAAWFAIVEKKPPIPVPYSTWAVTDALGRKVASPAEVGPPREDKYVGVFYYVWHGAHGQDIYDISKIIQDPPQARQWGPLHTFHFWGEPEEGYFRPDDPWYIRRNLQMLSDAGVDFLYFDFTNAVTYMDTINKMSDISLQMRSEGIRTPDFTFITNTNSGETINDIYEQYYTNTDYEALWFMWDGKPLILGDSGDTRLSEAAREFFTFRYSWVFTNAEQFPDHWQFIDSYPQSYGWHEDPDLPEQVSVSAAQHPETNRGQSYHNGQQPLVDELHLSEHTGEGLHFIEQWERALEVDPQVVMITQWNEFIAQRFLWGYGDSVFAGRPIQQGDSYFVDLYNAEFNRDLAPMKGGYTDNHYYLMLSYIRQFKGMEPAPATDARREIVIDGQFADWAEVRPIYTDPEGDTLHRDWPGYDPNIRYTNATGRNDIVESRVAYSDEMIYFMARTAEALTPHTDPYWMHLYIDADQSKETGWEGYDYAVNINVISDELTTLSKYENGQWAAAGTIQYRYSGNQLELAIPRSLLGLGGAGSGGNSPGFALQFKWADNIQALYDVTEFFLNGDAAPNRRANYYFSSAD